VTELRGWSDHDLERSRDGLTVPLRWDAASERPLRRKSAGTRPSAKSAPSCARIDPKAVVFYASGRASLETSYMYQLLARMYGNNNLPDSSNMCHESTSVALPKSIGVPVGTVTLDDFEQTDCIFFFGQNPGTNSPRMLHQLQDARKRGVPIITFNPLRERGLVQLHQPAVAAGDAERAETRSARSIHQVKPAATSPRMMGLCKALIEADDEARRSSAGGARVLDTPSSRAHPRLRGLRGVGAGHRLERDRAESGLTRRTWRQAAATYRQRRACHRHLRHGPDAAPQRRAERADAGQPAAAARQHRQGRAPGICPVRGHSNVQGQRTVGITEKPELAPLDKLKEQYGFEPPREKGLNTVEACEGVLAGKVRPSSAWAATSCAPCPTPTGWRRPGASCG
jgi:predicted molibdopterin-dependent oxidoreductase YjgC